MQTSIVGVVARLDSQVATPRVGVGPSTGAGHSTSLRMIVFLSVYRTHEQFLLVGRNTYPF